MIATCNLVVFWLIIVLVCVTPPIMFGLPLWFRIAREIKHP